MLANIFWLNMSSVSFHTSAFEVRLKGCSFSKPSEGFVKPRTVKAQAYYSRINHAMRHGGRETTPIRDGTVDDFRCVKRCVCCDVVIFPFLPGIRKIWTSWRCQAGPWWLAWNAGKTRNSYPKIMKQKDREMDVWMFPHMKSKWWLFQSYVFEMYTHCFKFWWNVSGTTLLVNLSLFEGMTMTNSYLRRFCWKSLFTDPTFKLSGGYLQR